MYRENLYILLVVYESFKSLVTLFSGEEMMSLASAMVVEFDSTKGEPMKPTK